jgi:hypothetical protein
MNQIKNDVAMPTIPQRGGRMKMRGDEKWNADLKLLLLPCLCDLNELRGWTNAADASIAGKTGG